MWMVAGSDLWMVAGCDNSERHTTMEKTAANAVFTPNVAAQRCRAGLRFPGDIASQRSTVSRLPSHGKLQPPWDDPLPVDALQVPPSSHQFDGQSPKHGCNTPPPPLRESPTLASESTKLVSHQEPCLRWSHVLSSWSYVLSRLVPFPPDPSQVVLRAV